MNPKNSQTFGESPMPIESAPNTSDDTMIMPMRLRFANERRDDDAAEHHPDAEGDLEHGEVHDVLLLAGVERAHEHQRRQVGGRHVSTKMIANRTSSQRTNAWWAT